MLARSPKPRAAWSPYTARDKRAWSHSDGSYRVTRGPIDLKNAGLLVLLCAVVAVVLSPTSEKTTGSPTPRASHQSQITLVNKDEAQNLRRTLVRSSGLSAEEFEERRVADRLDAIQAMEKANDSKMLTALGNAMADPAKEVKEAALQALAEKEDGIVTQLIRLGLNDADPEFRMEVLEVLADRGDRASLRRGKTDPNEEVRQRAADLLESAGR